MANTFPWEKLSLNTLLANSVHDKLAIIFLFLTETSMMFNAI